MGAIQEASRCLAWREVLSAPHFELDVEIFEGDAEHLLKDFPPIPRVRKAPKSIQASGLLERSNCRVTARNASG